MSGFVYHTIHKSMHRPNLWLGADRELGMTTALFSFILIVADQTIISAVIGVVFWIVGMWALRRMAKADPHLRHVYMRYLGYRKFMPARSRPWHIARVRNSSQISAMTHGRL